MSPAAADAGRRKAPRPRKGMPPGGGPSPGPNGAGPHPAGAAAAPAAAPSDVPSNGQHEDPTRAQLRKLFEVWVDSELKAQVVIFFNNNPGVVETVEGLAKRLGLDATLLRDAVADHVRLGLLEERHLGDKKVLVFNRNKRSEIHGAVVDALHRRAREGAA